MLGPEPEGPELSTYSGAASSQFEKVERGLWYSGGVDGLFLCFVLDESESEEMDGDRSSRIGDERLNAALPPDSISVLTARRNTD